MALPWSLVIINVFPPNEDMPDTHQVDDPKGSPPHSMQHPGVPGSLCSPPRWLVERMIKTAILHCFGDVQGLDLPLTGQVSDCPGNFENPVMRPHAEVQSLKYLV